MKKILAIVVSITVLFSSMATYASPWDGLKESFEKTKKDLEEVKEKLEEGFKEKLEEQRAEIGYDVLNKKYGSFVKTENVVVKEFPDEVYQKAKKEIMNIGVTSYWADHILQKVLGVDDDNVGKKALENLPGIIPSSYKDKIEKIINKYLNAGNYKELDLTFEPIIPNNRLEGFKAVYEVPIKEDMPFKGEVLVTLKQEIQEGARDNIEVEVECQMINGKKRIISQEEMLHYTEENQDVYEMTLQDITADKVKNIQLIYKNTVDIPTPPADAIARGLQKGLNDWSPFGDPISNKARDDIKKALEKIGINDTLFNGDYAVIIGDYVLPLIPVVGQGIKVLKAAGFEEEVYDVIRDVIGQDEVASKAKISNTQMFIKTLENSPFSKTIDFEDKKLLDKALDTFVHYTYEEDTGYDPKVTEFQWGQHKKVLGIYEQHAKVGPKSIIKNSYGTDIEFIADVYIHNSEDGNSYDDAGLIFRVTDPKLGNQNLKGYYCAISDKNNEAKIGKFNNNYKTLKSASINIESGKWHRLKVTAIGDEIKFYVNNMRDPIVQVKDSSYKGGLAGIRHFSINALKWTFWDNISLYRVSKEDQQTSKGFKVQGTTLVEYTGSGGDVVIPDGITTIGEKAFAGTPITNITIPKGVKVISREAFLRCRELKSVTLPDKLTTIGADAFRECRNLETINFPDSLTSIGPGAFQSCTSLEKVTIPSNIKTIELWTFQWCTSLNDVVLHEGLETIKGTSFEGCRSLGEVVIPKSVKEINYRAFIRSDNAVLVLYENSTPHRFILDYIKEYPKMEDHWKKKIKVVPAN